MNRKQKQHQTIVAGHSTAVNVIGTQREDLGFALKIWKRKVKEAGVLEIIKNRKTFTKPSVAKRETLSKAKYRQMMFDRNNKF